MISSHRVPTLPSWNSLLTQLSWILQSDIWELLEDYAPKGNILIKQLEGSLLRNCFLMCECNLHSETFLFSDQFANTIFLKSAMGYFLAQWSLRWQRKYRQMKTRKKLLWNFLVMCEFISLSFTYVSWSSPLTMSLRNWEGFLWNALRLPLRKELSSV